MTIGWIEISKKKYGGVLYNQEARLALLENNEVELVIKEPKFFSKFRYFKIIESLFLLTQLRGFKDFWIRDHFSLLTMLFDKTKGKNIVVIHHFDFSGFPFPANILLSFIRDAFSYRILKKVDSIVTVSKYWEKHFKDKGYSNVHTIYNGFDISQFQILEKEVSEFKKLHKLEGKPIIYIGNAQKAKGVVESYNALKDLDVHLVTSGKSDSISPARNFDLSYKDYLLLLSASSIVITMSKFKEGWCRTVHEAMLCKTPVIGSGRGGMQELLEGGNQIVCPNFDSLKNKVNTLLRDEKLQGKMGNQAYSFAKEYTIERFNREWDSFVKRL